MDAERVLDDTPYSLPPEADEALAEMRTRTRMSRTALRDALKEAERIGLVREMDRVHAHWTVFESNSIEFEGPDLSGTVEAIESAAGQDVIRDLNVTLLPELLRLDRLRSGRPGDRPSARLAVRRRPEHGRDPVRRPLAPLGDRGWGGAGMSVAGCGSGPCSAAGRAETPISVHRAPLS